MRTGLRSHEADSCWVDRCGTEVPDHQVQGVTVGLEAVLALGAAGPVRDDVAGFAQAVDVGSASVQSTG